MSTFSIDVPTPAAAPSLQAQPVRVGVAGGAREAALSLNPPREGEGFDMAPLMALGDNLLQPVIKAQQEHAFYQGVQRAVAGETAADIEAERPAWARAFGTSDAVRGARYHEQITDSAELERRVIESLPETRTMPPEQFSDNIRRTVAAMKTGDPTRDAILEASVLQFLPGALKMHQRAHLDYQQKQAAAASEQSIQKQIGVVETMAAQQRENPASADDESMQGAMFRSLSMLQVPPGVEPEAHFTRVGNGLLAALAEGQFTTYTFMKQQGVLDKLPVALRDNLSKAADAAARKFIQEKTPLDGRMAAFNLMNNYAEYDGEKLLSAVDKLNAQIRARTGIPADFIPQGMKDNLLQARLNWNQAEAARATTAAGKAAERAAEVEAERQQMATVQQLIEDPNGAPQSAKELFTALPAKSQNALLNVVWAKTESIQDPAQRRAAQVAAATKVGDIPVSSGIAASNVTASQTWSASTDHQVQLVLAMPPDILGKYKAAGTDVDLMQAYWQVRQSSPEVDAQTAWSSAKAAARLKGRQEPLREADEEELIEAFEGSNNLTLFGIKIGEKATVGTAGTMPFLRKAYTDAPGLSNNRAQSAVSMAQAEGVRYVGGVAFMKADNRPGSPEWNDPRYFPGISGPAKQELLARGMAGAIEAETKRNKEFNPDNIVSIMQQPDIGGKLMMSVLYLYESPTGPKQASFLVSQDAIKSHYSALVAARDKKTKYAHSGDLPGMTDAEYEARLGKLRPSAR